MKAKEYAQRYKDAGKTDEELFRIWKDMFFEAQEIANVRHVSHDTGMSSIFKELDEKWRAFARIAGNGVEP